ncbi:hypothetical protein, partial [Alkalibacterium sp. s-m-28]
TGTLQAIFKRKSAESNIKSGIIIGTKSMTPRVKGYFLTAKLESLSIKRVCHLSQMIPLTDLVPSSAHHIPI